MNLKKLQIAHELLSLSRHLETFKKGCIFAINENGLSNLTFVIKKLDEITNIFVEESKNESK